jgi:hypothetical protein
MLIFFQKNPSSTKTLEQSGIIGCVSRENFLNGAKIFSILTTDDTL